MVSSQDTHILATSVHENTLVTRTPSGGYVLKPTKQTIEFQTERQVPKTGLVLFFLQYCPLWIQLILPALLVQPHVSRLGWEQWHYRHSHSPGQQA
jgi:hypothetical protein